MTTIVAETPEHFESIRRLTIEAFDASDFGHNGEADLVESIRDQCDNGEMVSLVAVDEGCVVGHIMFSRAEIRLESSVLHGMGLAPMSVDPAHQRRGVGSMLVREGLQRTAQFANAFTVVAGHPDYYPRFGFASAQQVSVTHGFYGMPQDVLFLHIPDESVLPKLSGGRVYYHSVFGPQHAD